MRMSRTFSKCSSNIYCDLIFAVSEPSTFRSIKFISFSETTGPKSRFKTTEHSEKLSRTHFKSFVYVGESARVNNFKSNLKRNGRDFDVLKGSPGIFDSI